MLVQLHLSSGWRLGLCGISILFSPPRSVSSIDFDGRSCARKMATDVHLFIGGIEDFSMLSRQRLTKRKFAGFSDVYGYSGLIVMVPDQEAGNHATVH